MRTILWVLLLAALLLFAVTNWTPVELRIWDNIVLETRLPALVIVAFVAGLAPMWLLHRARVWNLKRRIASLESSVRTAAMAAPADTPIAATPVTATATASADPAPAGTPHPFGEPL
ncbi:LapA family protein [Croceibacterium sp. TMG7-5b_MA50]|uniref:LapA family protein n=1 Tax=Croceibacterium sp. TMG7-5b_MA50 TaxID=3121290 RepID=UPI003221F409